VTSEVQVIRVKLFFKFNALSDVNGLEIENLILERTKITGGEFNDQRLARLNALVSISAIDSVSIVGSTGGTDNAALWKVTMSAFQI